MLKTRHVGCCVWILATYIPELGAAAPRIERRLPPPGIEIPVEDRERLETRLGELKSQLQMIEVGKRPDVEVFLKAVNYAILHNEFYSEKEFPRAYQALNIAKERINQLATGKSIWEHKRGLVVRGYRSSIDGSAQPYGLVIPNDFDFTKPAPLYIWLHGRGDKTTDLHFIHRRLSSAGQIQPPGAIVLHPFGRQCIGYKSAGEIDVLEAVKHAMRNYKIDHRRIVLMGFSMGGAGAWHLGAHHAHGLVAISPGAGFAETAQYQNLAREDYPPWFVQRMWGLYDVPNYVRNLFNTPTVVYSGELDKQIQAARVMEQAYRDHGRELPHIIGPGMGHRYHPDSLKEIMRQMGVAVKRGLNRIPKKVTLQTQTLRYHKMFWVEVRGLKEHWRDSRIDAERDDGGKVTVKTTNVTELRLTDLPESHVSIQVDGQSIELPATKDTTRFVDLKQEDGHWRIADSRRYRDGLKKRVHLQGPIDDVFMDPFLVVFPSGRSSNTEVQEWLDFEQQHFMDRWRALFRGEARVKKDVDVTADDLLKYHIVAWGTPETNQFLSVLASDSSGPPIRWTKDEVRVGDKVFAATHHVPVFVYPRSNNKYLVVNSGPTFREGHDRTNSLQNPKLPDWAVLDIRQPPNNVVAGRVVAADFFDEQWRLKPRNIDPTSREDPN